LHESIAVHETHAPVRHTALVPHEVPSVARLPVSLHVACPPEHMVVPWLQGLPGGTQGALTVQGAQLPLLQ
jgi:hypothetical protein